MSARILMAGGALLLVACGGARPLDNSDVATPPQPALVRGVLLQEDFALDPAMVTHLDFEVPPRHNLTITVDWTLPSNNVLAVLTSSECPDINTALEGGCLARKTQWAPSFPSPQLGPQEPRVLTYDSINVTVPARLWIANAGATSEAVTVEVRYCAVPPDCGSWGMCLACWGG